MKIKADLSLKNYEESHQLTRTILCDSLVIKGEICFIDALYHFLIGLHYVSKETIIRNLYLWHAVQIASLLPHL